VDSTSALQAAKDAAGAALRISPNDGRALLMRCWAMKSLLLELPSDRDLSETISACEAAVQADPRSVPALHALGALYDQSCQDDLAVLSWQRGMEIGRDLDRSWEGRLRQGLLALALQHHRLGDAESQLDALQALQAQEDRFGPRALSRRLGPGPVRSHHVVRAAILLRRGSTDAAEAELWRELRHGPEQQPPEGWAEAASLQGLSRLARLKGKTLAPEYVRRLSDLKARFRAEESSSSSYSTLASAFSLVDVDAAIEWMRVVKPQNTCDVALQRAALLRDAGRLDDARRALQECGSSERWVKHCAQVMLYDVPPAPELSSVR
jgi:tetratricopeptide (TPR) repeat protein